MTRPSRTDRSATAGVDLSSSEPLSKVLAAPRMSDGAGYDLAGAPRTNVAFALQLVVLVTRFVERHRGGRRSRSHRLNGFWSLSYRCRLRRRAGWFGVSVAELGFQARKMDQLLVRRLHGHRLQLVWILQEVVGQRRPVLCIKDGVPVDDLEGLGTERGQCFLHLRLCLFKDSIEVSVGLFELFETGVVVGEMFIDHTRGRVLLDAGTLGLAFFVNDPTGYEGGLFATPLRLVAQELLVVGVLGVALVVDVVEFWLGPSFRRLPSRLSTTWTARCGRRGVGCGLRRFEGLALLTQLREPGFFCLDVAAHVILPPGQLINLGLDGLTALRQTAASFGGFFCLARLFLLRTLVGRGLGRLLVGFL